ncbi:hypothetical protein LTR67_001585 [Exophiala xenobiotica]|jgi:propanol-preferring alcohol dehydrogenase
MKAYQYENAKTGLQLKDVPIPEPLAGQALLRVEAAGLCHSDVHIMRGHGDAWLSKKPITLGHEVAGTVTKLGPGVTNVRVGDRVACGLTPEPVAITGFGKAPGLGLDGGYAEYLIMWASVLVVIPEAVSFAQAAVAVDSIATAYHAVKTEGEVRAGTTVAIVGLGGLGINGVRIAALQGAVVYGIDIDTKKFEDAMRQGAHACYQSLEELSSVSLDVVVDFAGVGSTTRAAITSVKPTGRVVLVGLGVEKMELSTHELVTRGVDLRGSLGAVDVEYREVLDLIANGSINPVLEEIPFTSVVEGLHRLERNEGAGRLFTRPNA